MSNELEKAKELVQADMNARAEKAMLILTEATEKIKLECNCEVVSNSEIFIQPKI